MVGYEKLGKYCRIIYMFFMLMTPSLFWRLRLLFRLQNKQLLPRPSIEKNINLIKTLLKAKSYRISHCRRLLLISENKKKLFFPDNFSDPFDETRVFEAAEEYENTPVTDVKL